MRPIIMLRAVSKCYSLEAPFEIRRALRWFRRARGSIGESPGGSRRHALRDLDLEVATGECVGVIGRNGAGKTTLLRLLAGVTLPTRGRLRVEGKVASLISLGMGFHPDLTGRENVHLYCALMGFSRKEIRARVDEILEFADLGEYTEVAFKRYSSGMMARVGFAAAVHVDPGILLLDEVLAVGDHAFQAKSLAKLVRLTAQCTVIFVSHDLAAVARLTRRAVWLDDGRLRAEGAPADVIAAYLAAQGAQPAGAA